MSLQRHLLNRWLRAVEKPRLRRETDPKRLRRALETHARLFFHAPRGTQKSWTWLDKIEALEVVPANLGDSRKVILYIHGGGFIFGSPRTHAAMVAQLAHRLRVRAVLPCYRLAPEAPFPAAPNDIMATWRALMAQGVRPGDVIVGGDSAGGALAFGLLSQLCAGREDMPGAVFGLSPLADMAHEGESLRVNAQSEVLLSAESAEVWGEMFLAGHPSDDPRVSPIYGDFHGAPPVWITVGDTEMLRDDARRLAALCAEHGANATLVEWHDLPHAWPIFHNILPEARDTLDALANWISQQPGWRDES